MAARTVARMTALAAALFAALALGYATGAQDTPQPAPQTTLKVGEVLRVGDRVITCDDLIARIYESELGNLQAARLVVPALLYLRDAALLELEAKRLGLVLLPEEVEQCTREQVSNYKEAVKRETKGVLSWKDWLKQYFGMTEEEFESYVRERASVVLRRRVLVNHFMRTTEGIEVWHILVSKQGDAQRIYDQLTAAGADDRNKLFEDLAVQKSEDRTSNLNRGRVGRINKHAWSIEPAEAEAALWALKDGEVTKPLKSNYGWHVFMRRQTFTPPAKPFAEMRDELMKAPDVDANASNTWVLFVRNTQKYTVEQRVPGLDCKPNQTKGSK